MSKIIAFEGIDGSGTTTQAHLAADLLRSRGIATHLTRQPSDGPVGRLIREFLADPVKNQRFFALLFAADRSDHGLREVEPALLRREVVVSDRWYHSSLAYLAPGFFSREEILDLNGFARRPDLTLFLRVSPEIAAHRRVAAGCARELFDNLEIQRQVALHYDASIDLVRARGEQVVVLDGEHSTGELALEIAGILREELP